MTPSFADPGLEGTSRMTETEQLGVSRPWVCGLRSVSVPTVADILELSDWERHWKVRERKRVFRGLEVP